MNRFAAALLPYLVVGIFAIQTLPIVGGAVEATFLPILRTVAVDHVEFRGSNLCWRWTWEKLRSAAPKIFRYYVQMENGPDIPTAVFRDSVPVIVPTERPVGRHVQGFCVALPPDMPVGTPLTISGYGVYEMPHRMWDVRQPLPDVKANQ